uniref:Uncharacterized protein n=1 Tax=Vespula pensylvanica TaxID=30213 RepID=A0A834PEK8_VESPE|nr:hypothetical protein H0235_000698 [Vespula pensylvanica]
MKRHPTAFFPNPLRSVENSVGRGHEPRQEAELHLETSEQPPACRESYHLSFAFLQSFDPFPLGTRPSSALNFFVLLVLPTRDRIVPTVERWQGVKGRLGPTYYLPTYYLPTPTWYSSLIYEVTKQRASSFLPWR